MEIRKTCSIGQLGIGQGISWERRGFALIWRDLTADVQILARGFIYLVDIIFHCSRFGIKFTPVCFCYGRLCEPLSDACW